MKNNYILIQEMDDFGHFYAWVRIIKPYDNLKKILDYSDDVKAANMYPTKKEAYAQAQALNQQWHERGVYKWDFMEDGVTPAPF